MSLKTLSLTRKERGKDPEREACLGKAIQFQAGLWAMVDGITALSCRQWTQVSGTGYGYHAA